MWVPHDPTLDTSELQSVCGHMSLRSDIHLWLHANTSLGLFIILLAAIAITLSSHTTTLRCLKVVICIPAPSRITIA